MKRQEGFTLIELMVVILIIGILVAIAVPVFFSARSSAQAGACQDNLRTIDGAIMQYSAATGGAYPAGRGQPWCPTTWRSDLRDARVPGGGSYLLAWQRNTAARRMPLRHRPHTY